MWGKRSCQLLKRLLVDSQENIFTDVTVFSESNLKIFILKLSHSKAYQLVAV